MNTPNTGTPRTSTPTPITQVRRIPSPVTKITPYCEALAFLRCPECNNCIALTVDETLTREVIPSLSPIIKRIRGSDDDTDTGSAQSATTETAKDFPQIIPSPEHNRNAAEENLESTPVRNFIQENEQVTDPSATPIWPTSDSGSNDPFRMERVHTSEVVELRRNPTSNLPCVPTGSSPRSVYNVGSSGFNTDVTDPEANTTVPLNIVDTMEERWRQCDEDFKNDIIGLLPRLEGLTRLARSLINDGPR